MDKKLIGLIGIIIALVLIIVAFFVPLYSMSTKGEGGLFGESLDMSYNFYLTKGETKGSLYGSEIHKL